MNIEEIMNGHGFELISGEPLAEIGGDAFTAVHKPSGARLLYLSNDDNNKSFAIGFRTPPKDDTGVFHILEHSVLCGSRRFPVKEPFVDLLKSSMQTFLNAMTFSDKTLYPVASTNEQDLYNLMDVYLDAVFHPNIYEKRAIFEQEGWHYELEASDEVQSAPLVCNGVVFNEMKGALSDATSVLYDELQALLFPDTCYAFESGGKPESICTLTYEDYLDDHRRHYRTDNSYIILYGNLDVDRALGFLDERYLTPVATEQRENDAARAAAGLAPLVPRTISLQAPTCANKRTPMDTAPENACLGCGYVIGTTKDRTRIMATSILLDAILGSNEAPLKRALLDLGVAHDVISFVADEVAQPFAVVQFNMPAPQGELDHADILQREVEKLVETGLDHGLVEAALSNAEFHLREHDFGMSDGVVYAMSALTGWLYDDACATDYLRYEDVLSELREKLDEGYFEELARSLFCENDHCGQVEIVPDENAPDVLADHIARVETQLTPDDRARIVAEEAVLRELQEAPDSPEASATLPRLSVADLDDEPEEPAYGLVDGMSVTCLRHEADTHGIVYAHRFFDLDGLLFDELPYAAVLALMLGKMDTARHTAAEIDTLAQGKLGSLTFSTQTFEDAHDVASAAPKLIVSASALSSNVEWTAALPREIMAETDFSDTGKILDVLKQRKIAMERAFVNAGHSCATARLRSYYTPAGVVAEQLGNVGFYQFLCDLIDDFDERASDLVERLSELAQRVFVDEGCLISFAGSDADFDAFWRSRPCMGETGGTVARGESALSVPEPVVRNEAFVTPSDVCYAATGWDRRLLGGDYDGAWAVAGRALSFDYLWNEVRVKGGAYGVGFQAMRSGNMRFYSYRDPHLDETLARFDAASGWLAAFDPEREDFEGFVVATVAGIDAPVKPRELVKRQAADFLSGQGPEERRAVRARVVSCDVQAVRALAPDIKRAFDQHAVCVFGNREILDSSQAGLNVVKLIG